MSYRVGCGVASFLYHFVSFTIILQFLSGVEKDFIIIKAFVVS
jgi:hypothetical protein